MTDNVRVLNTQVEVEDAVYAARYSYADRWQAFFGFPAPDELLDRWWPLRSEER